MQETKNRKLRSKKSRKYY